MNVLRRNDDAMKNYACVKNKHSMQLNAQIGNQIIFTARSSQLAAQNFLNAKELFRYRY